MTWLLDTNVVSELAKPKPDKQLLSFVKKAMTDNAALSIVSMIEIEKGISALEDSPRKFQLQAWHSGPLQDMFGKDVLAVDRAVLSAAIDLVNVSNKLRFSPGLTDMLIAATAMAHRLKLLTRNTKDFAPLGLPIVNPFTGERFNGA